MPPLVCSRCKNANPETASFCYYDGEALRGGQAAPAARRDAAPADRGAGPRLDLQPRRLHLGNILPGETRHVEVTVSNQGQGVLQGTLTVAEGGEWLRVGAGNGQCELKTPREQKVRLQVDTRGLPAAQTYGAKLTVITNGGAFEVPVRLDLAAHQFAKAPFQGARAPRELAEKMRAQPKHAVPMLESGEVARWFATNGWNYPIRGTPARGVAGVQQFFEAMGLSKPPVVQISHPEVHVNCPTAAPVRAQLMLHTASKKWVYGNVESDAPWLKVLTPHVAGPQQTAIGFEVDPTLAPRGTVAEGALTIHANGDQALIVRVRARTAGGQVGLGGRLVRQMLALTLACLLLRLLVAPLADLYARGAATQTALAKVPHNPVQVESWLGEAGGWLHLPWPGILLATDPALLDDYLGGPHDPLSNRTREFRDVFASQFIRTLALWTWWIGAAGGAWLACRRGGVLNLPWGLVAGAVAGVAGGATLACLVLVGDLVPHALFAALSGAGGVGALVLWILLAAVCWALLGAGLGALLSLTGPFGRTLLAPVLGALAGLCRLLGLRGLAAYFAAA